MLLQQATQPVSSGGFPVGWELVATVVAVLALIQPWIIALFRRYFRKGIAEYYESGKLSIYFLNQGSGLELTGTVKANHQDQFLRSMDILVVRLENQSRHAFAWQSFRYAVVDFQGVSKSDFGIASSMMVTTAKPEYLDTLFFDTASEREVEAIRERVKALWRPFYANKLAEALAAAAPPPVAVGSASALAIVPAPAPQMDVDQAYEEFAQRIDVTEQKASLDRACYWRAGEYSITLNLNTDQPVRTFAHSSSFQITEDHVAVLRGNLDAIIRSWCNMPNPGWSNETAVQVPYVLTRPK